MSAVNRSTARAAADVSEGFMLATVELAVDWWVRPRDVCMATCIGWETSFERLAELLASGK